MPNLSAANAMTNTPLNLLRIGAAVLLSAAAGFAVAQVGMRETALGGMPVTLVYPTAEKTKTHERGPFRIEVALNAQPSAGVGRLIVISHGTGGSAITDHALAARLAQAGFLVAQPLHEGDNYQDTKRAGPESFQRRPREVSRLIDALAADQEWGGRFDATRVGVHGMSAGGVTGLALAGAQWRVLNLVKHCQDHLQADDGFCLQGAAAPEARAARQASFERARGVPEQYLPPMLTDWHGGRSPSEVNSDARPDTRIASVSLAVPVAAVFSAESLARIRIPVGIVSAQQDTVLLPQLHSSHVLANCRTCTTLTDLPGAGHFDVLWPWPAAVAQQVATGQVRGGAPMPGFDALLRDSAQDKIVAFHLKNLRSGSGRGQ